MIGALSKPNTSLLLERLLAIREAEHGTWTPASLLYYPGSSGLAGPYQGRGSVAGLLRRLDDLTNATFAFVPQRSIADDERILIRSGRSRGSRAGTKLDVATMQVVSRCNGEIREAWLFNADQARCDDFWSS